MVRQNTGHLVYWGDDRRGFKYTIKMVIVFFLRIK